jgi:hypothetical protein
MLRKNGIYLILIVASCLFVNACSASSPLPINADSPLTETNSVTSPQPQNISADSTFTITFEVEGKGTILPSPGVHTYNYGDIVTITAGEVPDWVFNCWLGDVTDKLSPTATITASRNQTITAYFSVIACYLDY